MIGYARRDETRLSGRIGSRKRPRIKEPNTRIKWEVKDRDPVQTIFKLRSSGAEVRGKNGGEAIERARGKGGKRREKEEDAGGRAELGETHDWSPPREPRTEFPMIIRYRKGKRGEVQTDTQKR